LKNVKWEALIKETMTTLLIQSVHWIRTALIAKQNYRRYVEEISIKEIYGIITTLVSQWKNRS